MTSTNLLFLDHYIRVDAKSWSRLLCRDCFILLYANNGNLYPSFVKSRRIPIFQKLRGEIPTLYLYKACAQFEGDDGAELCHL